MFRIGEFSKLAKTTVKTLRFYEEAGLLEPARVDEWTGYRYYTTEQLYPLQTIMSLRQAGLSIQEIRVFLSGGDTAAILDGRRTQLEGELSDAQARLSRLNIIINDLKENKIMSYQAVVKEIPGYKAYYKQGRIRDFSEMSAFILGSANECLAVNPGMKCIEPSYCYVSYLDPEFKPENILIEYAQAVEQTGIETETVKFKTLAPITAACVYHKGSYDNLGEAYAFIVNWVKENGYTVAGPSRETYIDGIWNKENPADWLTEIQLPIIK